MDLGEHDRSGKSLIQLNAAQAKVLAWIVEGCPTGTFPVDSFAHRITARALRSRGLVEISGHGDSWRAAPTKRGSAWPEAVDVDRRERAARHAAALRGKVADGSPSAATAGSRAIGSLSSQARPRKPVPVKQVNKQEIYMRYKVVVTRVQVAERWIRATDEEDAARKVRDEFEKPYAYFGHWETKGSEIEIIEAEQTTVIKPSLLDASGPMMLTLKDAAAALGIPYSALYEQTNRGDIEYTRIGSRKYISRESLMSFIRENTRRGYSPS